MHVCSMYVGMYVCVYIYASKNAYMHVRTMHVRMNEYMYLCMYVCMYT